MPQDRKIILAGGSGFLGSALAPDLIAAGYQPIILTRGPDRPASAETPAPHVHWDPRSAGPWAQHLDGAAAIVNLVGRSVNCRKTPANRHEILHSRVDSVRALAAGVKQADSPPPLWIQQSTAHIYGDTADEILDESSPIGTGFAPQVGVAWEKAFAEAELPGCRRLVLRTSFVLGRGGGGALGTLARLAKLFLGGRVGTGRQWISWIHVADLNRIILRALEEPAMGGTYVVTSPNPVTNEQFMRELRRAVGRPWSPPAPAPLVRLGSWLIRTDPELALLGRRCVPTRLLSENFVFRFPELPEALDDLLR